MLMGVKLPRKFFFLGLVLLSSNFKEGLKKRMKKKQKKNTDNLIMSIF